MSASSKPQQVLADLKAGNERFLQGTSIHSSGSSLRKLKNFSLTGQFPKAIVLCCSDSRAPVEMIFDQDIGDLFVIRVAGNIIAPSLVGSVEFAAAMFNSPLVLVMGHTQCGAVKATLDYIAEPHTIMSENIHDIVGRIKPHIFPLAQIRDMPYEERLSRSVEANVRASVSQLSHSSRLVEGLVEEKKIEILGAVLNLSSGQVDFLEM